MTKKWSHLRNKSGFVTKVNNKFAKSERSLWTCQVERINQSLRFRPTKHVEILIDPIDVSPTQDRNL